MASHRAGQASLELLLIFAVALFILLAIILVTSEQLGGISALKGQDDAQNSVQDISAAAKDVYSQGEGAKRNVYVYIPPGYDASKSFVANRSLVLNVGGTDYVSSEAFEVHGSWPSTPGGHWVWVISEGNRVRIGTAMLYLSRSAVSAIMERNSAASESFYAENIWDRNISVQASLSWPHANVSVAPSTYAFSLEPGQKQPITLSISTGAAAAGYYSGEMLFTATDGNSSEPVALPISVEVAGYRPGETPPLNVTPGLWAENLYQTNSSSAVFTVCTNDYTSLTGVAFTPAAGAPGDWVSSTEPLGPMAAGTCVLKTMTITIPANASDGTYRGEIQVSGQGAPDAEDTISLFIVVGGGDAAGTCSPGLSNLTLCNCPVGSLYWEIPVCMCQPATIYVQNGTIFGGPANGTEYNGTISGGPGIDIIAGTDGADIILADESGDLVCGHGGPDIIYGGNGDDIIDGGRADDVLYGESGYDKIYGKEGNDDIHGGQGNDQIDGGEGDDSLYGDDQDDLIYGGPGNDMMFGGANKDTLCGGSGNDTIDAGEGNDLLDGGGDINVLDGGGSGGDCYRGQTQYNCTPKAGYPAVCGPS